jgi:hypothetical protein
MLSRLDQSTAQQGQEASSNMHFYEGEKGDIGASPTLFFFPH